MSVFTNSSSSTTKPAKNESGPCEEILTNALEHCVLSFASINQMRKNEQLCDVTLEVGDETLHAHKVILASASLYFYAMFNNDMLERTQGTVRLHDMDVVIVKLLIDYIYTGEINITEENVQLLLSASSMLQMHSIEEACGDFMLRQLHPSNCLAIKSFADTHSCRELYNKAHKYILHNFQKIAKTEEFLQLPYEEVRDLISSNLLNICSEEIVFHAAVNWIKHDLDKRQNYIGDLLNHVRLPLLHCDFLTSCVESEPLIRDNPQCNKLLLEALKCHLLPKHRSLMDNPRIQERRPEGMMPYIFAIGGSNETILYECEVYNPRSNTWSEIAPMSSERERSGVVALRKYLYAVGGNDGSNDLDIAECYNPMTNTWSYITPMGTKRSSMGICVFDGLIYVCGGFDGASFLRSAERYDPLTGIWSSCPAMETRRKSSRMTVLDNCIYCCGGFDSNSSHSSVERLDPREGRWYSVPSMSLRRSACGVASYDGVLYCIGGYDGTNCMASGECYDPRRNTWEPIAAMHSRRSTHEVVEVNGSLYALGGNNGSTNFNSMERYDISLDKWTFASSMAERRGLVGADVLECFDLESVLG